MGFGQDELDGTDGEGRFSFPGAIRVAAGVVVLPVFGLWIVAYLAILVNSIIFNCGMSRGV